MPNDHARAIVELLRMPGGSGLELGRRWLAALLLAPADEREAIVDAVEARLAQLYDTPPDPHSTSETDEPMVHLAGPAVQRDGYTEVTIRSYPAAPAPPARTAQRRPARGA
ncbi:MAG: hypothetical protein SFZ24_05480 [Planctomycetota bacterium]|nr:hypothetical protein [Planctomycetota bacterium]